MAKPIPSQIPLEGIRVALADGDTAALYALADAFSECDDPRAFACELNFAKLTPEGTNDIWQECQLAGRV